MENETNGTFNASYCNETLPPTLQPGEEQIVAVVSITLWAIIMVVGIPGNSLVIIVVALNKHMRSATNLLITNLALADLTFLCIVVPFTAMRYAYPAWVGGDESCKIVQYLLYMTAWASIYTLVIMSMVRYVAIVFPILSLKFLHSRRNISVAIATVWIGVALVNIPAYLHFGKFRYIYNCQQRSLCGFITFSEKDMKPIPEKVEQMKIFHICFLTFGFVLPLLIITVLYTFILRALKAGGTIKESQTKENLRSKKRATRMVFVVVMAFVICWLPLQLMLIIASYGFRPPVFITVFSNTMAFANSCINPILYAFLSVNFRQGFAKLLRCEAKPKRHVVSTTEFSMAPMDDTTSCS